MRAWWDVSREDPRFVELGEISPETILFDGFEAAYLGSTSGLGEIRAVYDRDLCVRVLAERDGMDEDDAEEFVRFNLEGAYLGEFTPILMERAPAAASGEGTE